MDPDLKERLERWCKDRNHDFAAVIDRIRESDYWEVARAQHLAGASDTVVWRLLDSAMG